MSRITINVSGYRVIRPIGRGGMATVYLAIQENFQREVALKVMSPALSADSDFSERFLREARIVSRLVHPHIVTVHDVGIENGHHYLSMEYVEGRDLKQSLPDLNGEQLFRVIKEVAMALDYAGRKGYVHRDVKPENIMLHENDGRAVLMDFGIARAADADNSMTRTGTALGTPHYMSPEQARGEAVDGRSDLYSLGVLLYYMLVGRVPYEADSPVAVGIKHVSAALPKLPAKLACYQYLIDKLMAKKPEDRYINGQELVAVLQQLDVSAVDQYRSQDNFEYLGGQHDTPLRSDAVNITPPTTPAEIPAPTTVAPTPEEPLHIPVEDLNGRLEQSSSSPWLIILTMVVVACGAGYYFYQQPIDNAVLALLSDESKVPVEQPVAEVPVVVSDIDKSGKEAEEENLPPVSEIVEELVVDSVNIEPVVEATQPNVDPVDALLTQAHLLNDQPEKLSQQVDIYRQVLLIDADETAALTALNTIKDKRFLLLSQNIDDGALEIAQQSLETTMQLFPEIAATQQYLQIAERLANAKQKISLLAQASEHLDNDRLINPEVNNAKETFEKVLAIDPDNIEAQQGLDKIAQRYLVLAQSFRSKRAYRKALLMVSNGLSVKPEDLALIALQEKLQAELKLEQDVQVLLALGDDLAQQKKWFGSGQDVAVKKYLKVLSMQPGRAEAGTKIISAVDEFVVDVNGLIAIKDYDVASAQVALALQLLPDNEKLKSTVVVLESLKPAIDSLVLSGNPITDAGAATVGNISADRTLHLSFGYKNLVSPTTVLQAVLFDGGRSVQIAGVPVVVTGEQGYTQFRIDRPVEGFAGGGYHIDILLAGERIFTHAFVIGK